MADLIDRQAAIEAVQEALAKMEHSNYFHIWTTTEVRVMVVERILKQLPTAEPKTGRWEMKPDPYGFFDEIPVCSECGCTTKWREKYLYCPNCGARMKGGYQ